MWDHVVQFWSFLNSAIVAAGLTALVVWFVGVRTLEGQRAIARRQATIDFLEKRKWDSDYIAARQDFIILRDDADRTMSYWAREAQADRPERSTIRNILNDYELMAIGIQQDIFDEKIYQAYWRGTLITDWKKTRAFIEDVREIANAEVYKSFQDLAEAWQAGRPFHDASNRKKNTT
ncbi:MAG: DUF4760 domain-containing protein [Pseudomonadota bacterium]